MRVVVGILGVVTLAILGGAIALVSSPIGQIYVPSGTGITAKQVCSLHFVTGMNPERARSLYIDPLLGDVAGLIEHRIDASNGIVDARAAGLGFEQTARYRPGLGCTLVHDEDSFDPTLTFDRGEAPELMVLDAVHRDANFDAEALNAAIETAFTDDGRNTLAIAILHNGRLIAEAYADGLNARSPMHGWSMSKSLAATYAGVLVQQGLVDIYAPGQVEALNAAGKPEITIDDLLRMTGGLAGHELNTGTDPNSDMLFTESDMANFAATRETLHEAGAHWEYQSGNTILAGAGLQQATGATLSENIDYLWTHLLQPLDMYDTVVESDEAGTLQWSSYVYASAQDWAKLGQLYLDGGRVGETQIIPENWLEYITTPTEGSDGSYGSGYWLNQSGLPTDAFVMNGFQSQRGIVIPSEDLVVVRMGATNWVNDGSYQLARDVIAAKR